ncbi:MAG: hypothetical protein MI810_22200 [Flavobacteriales bacterium]|nr:hypothetical protein [Flavobacteriales bacterium]
MRLLIIVCLSLMFGTVYGQSSSLLKLKNGSEIVGDVEETADGKYRVEIQGGSVFVYDKQEVISVEEHRPKVSRLGFFSRLDGGVIGGADDASPSFHVVNGFGLTDRFQVGLGFGVEAINWSAFIPVFAEGRFNILKGGSIPFLYVTSGYEVPMTNFEWNKGGYVGGVGAGFEHAFQVFGQPFGVSTTLGYKFGWIRQRDQWGWEDFWIIRQINRFELRFAFTIR